LLGGAGEENRGARQWGLARGVGDDHLEAAGLGLGERGEGEAEQDPGEASRVVHEPACYPRGEERRQGAIRNSLASRSASAVRTGGRRAPLRPSPPRSATCRRSGG